MKNLLVLSSLILISCIIVNAQENLEVELINYSDKFSISSTNLSDFKVKSVVKDSLNEPIQNLTKNNFRVFKDGFEAEILRVRPLSEAIGSKIKVFLCIDNSSSMSGSIDDLKVILDSLISSFAFSTELSVLFFEERFDKNKVEMDETLLNISSKTFKNITNDLSNYISTKLVKDKLTLKTYLYDQIYHALLSANQSSFDGKDIFFIILSDGEDFWSRFNEQEIFNNYSKGTIYSVNFRSNSNKLLMKLSAVSNGIYFESDNVELLKKQFALIGQRIKFSGYEIEYLSNVPPKLFLNHIYEIRNNQKIDITKIKVEEFNSREIFPLLNYIFFDKDSFNIPNRYKNLGNSLKSDFDLRELKPEQLDIYYNLLNIIGFRLLVYPEAKITLIGCNDNSGNERNNLELSRNRAESVKNYFVETWKIDKNRIATENRNLPLKYSNIKYDYGSEENRRVEIYSDNPNILDAVEVYSVTNISTPEAIQLNFNYNSDYALSNWKFTVFQDNNQLFEKVGVGTIPENFSWNISSSIKNIHISDSDILLTLVAENQNGLKSQELNKIISVDFSSKEDRKREFLEDKFIEKLNLVLFEFNSSDLDDKNTKVLKYLQNSINDSSKILVKGYTDNSGSEIINQNLSYNRAKSTLNALINLLKPKTKLLTSQGFGEMAPLYDNNLPEGRFYNRTCQIVIENIISNDFEQ